MEEKTVKLETHQALLAALQEQRDRADTITFPVYNLGSATVSSADVAAHS